MSTFEPVDLIEVRAWGRRVGAVALDPRTGFYAFEYDDGWVGSGHELAPLRMPVSAEVYVFPELDPATFLRLPALLADALPDRFGNALVNAWMAEHGVTGGRVTALDRLAYQADRGMGALEFHPPAGAPLDGSIALQLADLVVAARAAVRGELHGEGAANEVVRALLQVGTSAGGARAKAVIALNPMTGQVRSGQLDVPEGFEHWLLKLDGVSGDPSREEDLLGDTAGYGKVEYAYYLMATEAGVTMSECRLLPEGSRTHFLTRRFDRGPAGERHHLMSLCAADHLDFNQARVHGYEQYLDVVRRLGLDDVALEQAYRRIVFNVVALNRDDHTKNFGFLLRDGGDWELAPAYDVTHAHNPVGEWTSSHQMSVNGRFDGITVADLHTLGDRFLVRAYKGIVRDTVAAVARWEDFADAAGVSASHCDRITEDLAEHPLR